MTTRTTVTVPEGLDLTDRNDRQRIEAGIKKKLGSTFEILWPRPKSKTRDVVAVDSRPGLQRVSLGPDVRPTMGGQVFAKLRSQGLQMVDFDVYGGVTLACVLDPATVAIRNRLAEALRCDPWSIEVVCNEVFDEALGRDRLDQICIVRLPPQGIVAEKRQTIWRELIPLLRDGGTGWLVDEDSVSGQVQLSYGPPRRLPKSVSMAELMPATMQPDLWHKIPLGINAEGKIVGVDLKLGPMGLVVGPTGSGKSVELRQHAASALAHGHELIVIDTNKSGLDFLRFKPWTVAWGGTLHTAQAILDAVYNEGQRRRAVLERYEIPSWSELPSEVRQREHIVPITVLIDEFMSMALQVPVPKGLEKGHPELVEANELNTSKAIILSKIGKIARELRFSGIFMVLATQRPDTSQISGFGEIRSNLTSSVQMVKPGSIPAQETLRMIFPGEQTAVAADTFRELDDGATIGLAAYASEGGEVEGFRVAFTQIDAIQPLLESIDIPQPKKWDIPGVTLAPVETGTAHEHGRDDS